MTVAAGKEVVPAGVENPLNVRGERRGDDAAGEKRVEGRRRTQGAYTLGTEARAERGGVGPELMSRCAR